MKIDLSPQWLKELREIALEATQGTWHDFYAPRGDDPMIEGDAEHSCAPILGLSPTRDDCPFCKGFDEVDPEWHLRGELLALCPMQVEVLPQDLAHMATFSPARVLAMLDEIESLRAKLKKAQAASAPKKGAV